MIVNDFPDSVEARIALMRLANIYLDQERYIESIDSLKILLKENARVLRKDALYVMAKALNGELLRLLKEDQFPAALRMVEKERFFIADMKTHDIHFITGEIYLKAHLYEEAEERFSLAQKLYGRNKIPEKLLKYRAVANKELGKLKESVEFLDKIIKEYKNPEETAWAFEMKGDIETQKELPENAIKHYLTAAKKYKKSKAKAEIYVKLGELYEKNKNLKKAEESFYESVSMYLSVNEENMTDKIAYTSRKLGEIKIKLNDYKGAVTSFKTVLETGGGKENVSEVRFLLGEAYKGMEKINEALLEYNKVLRMETDDEFWKKIAGQRIREIELKKEIKDS